MLIVYSVYGLSWWIFRQFRLVLNVMHTNVSQRCAGDFDATWSKDWAEWRDGKLGSNWKSRCLFHLQIQEEKFIGGDDTIQGLFSPTCFLGVVITFMVNISIKVPGPRTDRKWGFYGSGPVTDPWIMIVFYFLVIGGRTCLVTVCNQKYVCGAAGDSI